MAEDTKKHTIAVMSAILLAPHLAKLNLNPEYRMEEETLRLKIRDTAQYCALIAADLYADVPSPW